MYCPHCAGPRTRQRAKKTKFGYTMWLVAAVRTIIAVRAHQAPPTETELDGP